MLDRISDQTIQLVRNAVLRLSHSEFRVLQGMLNGHSSQEIAQATGLTKLTVQFYAKVILRKTGANRIELARIAHVLEGDPHVVRYAQSIAEVGGRSATDEDNASRVTFAVREGIPVLSAGPSSRELRRRPFAVKRRFALR
jgi:DNA-binding CsgD family transcriptional regulator